MRLEGEYLSSTTMNLTSLTVLVVHKRDVRHAFVSE
jgi:hypothetical protein